MESQKKSISQLFYAKDLFDRFCQGTVFSIAERETLDVYDE